MQYLQTSFWTFTKKIFKRHTHTVALGSEFQKMKWNDEDRNNYWNLDLNRETIPEISDFVYMPTRVSSLVGERIWVSDVSEDLYCQTGRMAPKPRMGRSWSRLSSELSLEFLLPMLSAQLYPTQLLSLFSCFETIIRSILVHFNFIGSLWILVSNFNESNWYF